jgi:hypothetical protein
MRRSLSRIVAIVLITFALGGCTTTTPIVSEWRNPAYASGSFKRIMVGGLGGETNVRRNFEDEFLVQLRAAGVDALPSYRYIAEDEKIDETKLKQAAQKAGAEAVLFARAVQVEQKSQPGPSYFPYTSFGIFGSHVGASWYGLGGVPSVYRYKEYVSETHCMTLSKTTWSGPVRSKQRSRRTCERRSSPTSKQS